MTANASEHDSATDIKSDSHERRADLKGPMTITLHKTAFGAFLLVAKDGRNILIQTDWDYPGVASTFGWSPCSCGATDGTVDCEHWTAHDMIVDAYEFLLAHEGDTTDDPGYF
jgi:hypothetical protein